MADNENNVILDSYFGDVNNSFYAGPNGADFHIRKVYGNLREMLADTIKDNSTVLIGDYFLVNYGNQNAPDDSSGNPDSIWGRKTKSYNRNKAIDAYGGTVIKYSSRADFPESGETGIIYIAIDTGVTYRWNDSDYVIDYDPGSSVLNAQASAGSAQQTVVLKTSLSLGGQYDWFLSSNRNYWYEIYTQSTSTKWAVRSVNTNTPTTDPYGNWSEYIYNYADLPELARRSPKILTIPGYYNATLWRRKATTSETEPEGQIDPFKYFELMFQSVSVVPDIDVTTHSINAGSIPTASISGPVESRTIDFGLPGQWGFTATVGAVNPSVTPTAVIEDISGNTTTKRIRFSLPGMWDITASHTLVNAGVSPTVTMSKTGATASITFALPKMWDIDATVTSTSGLPSVTVTGATATKTFSFALPVVPPTPNENLVYNPWFTVNSRGFEQYRGYQCGYVLANNGEILHTNSITISSIKYELDNQNVEKNNVESMTLLIDGVTKTINVDGYILDAEENPTSSIVYTNNRDFRPGRIHWITGNDYGFDSWQFPARVGAMNASLTILQKNSEDHGIKLTSCSSPTTTYNSTNSAAIISYLDDPSLLYGKTVTLSVEYKREGLDDSFIKGSQSGTIPFPSSSVLFRCVIDPFMNTGDGSQSATAKIAIFSDGSVGVLLQARAGSTTQYKKVKVEFGSESTLDYDLEPNLIKEYEKCRQRYLIASPSNEDDDYARGWPQSPDVFMSTTVFPVKGKRVTSSLYEVGLTYLENQAANSIAYQGQIDYTGDILNATEDIQLVGTDGDAPMVCGTFAQLMLAGVPYDQSRIATGQKETKTYYDFKGNLQTDQKVLVGGSNTPLVGKCCFNLQSPIIQNYWGRYAPQKQLYSATFARILYDANLLHEVKSLSDIRPGDLIFFNASRQTGQPIGYSHTYKGDKAEGALNYRRWDSIQHVELFLGWQRTSRNQTNLTLKGYSLSTNANAKTGSVAGIWYRSFPPEGSNTFESQTSKLAWYARLNASTDPPQGLYNNLIYTEASQSGTPGGTSISLPYIWESVPNIIAQQGNDTQQGINAEDEYWRYTGVPAKDIGKDKFYTIVLKAQQYDDNNSKWTTLSNNIFWDLSLCAKIAGTRSTIAAFQISNDKTFQFGQDTYYCLCYVASDSTSVSSFGSLAIRPSVADRTKNYKVRLQEIQIYEGIVVYTY